VSIGIPSSSITLDAVPFVPRRFTVEEYHRMAELGVLTEEDRVELLEGVITPKMVHNPPHDGTIGLLEVALRSLLPLGWFIRVQSAITTADSEPEPDIAVARGTARDYLRRHPGPSDVSMVIEVADSSLAVDRKKSRIYANAGVPVYWIVNLVDRQIEVSLRPAGSTGTEYQPAAIHRPGDVVPVIIDGEPVGALRVDDLLP
jgi:Uma2 family endonuclease